MLLTPLGSKNSWPATGQYSWVWIFLGWSSASSANCRLLFPAQRLNHKSNGKRFTVKGHCTIGQWREILEGQLTHCSCLETIKRETCAAVLRVFLASVLKVSRVSVSSSTGLAYCSAMARLDALHQIVRCLAAVVWPWKPSCFMWLKTADEERHRYYPFTGNIH